MHLLLGVTEETTLDSVSRDNIIQHKRKHSTKEMFHNPGAETPNTRDIQPTPTSNYSHNPSTHVASTFAHRNTQGDFPKMSNDTSTALEVG